MTNIYNKIEADWLKRDNETSDKLIQFWKGKCKHRGEWLVFTATAAIIGWVYIVIMMLNK